MDAAQHPSVKSIADLGKQNIKVLYYNGAPFMAYLIGKRILKQVRSTGHLTGHRPGGWPVAGKSLNKGSPPPTHTNTSTRSSSG